MSLLRPTPLALPSLVLCLAVLLQPAAASADEVRFERQSFPLDEPAWGVGVADVNGDGRRDILVGASSKAWAYLAPDWERRLLHDFVGGRLLHATVLDCDRDGDLDFVVARVRSPWVAYRQAREKGEAAERPDGPDFTVAWLENTGQVGRPMRLHALETDFDSVHGLATGDVNGDGLLDLVASSFAGPEADSIALHLAKASEPGFAPSRITRGGAPGRAHYLAIADLTGDGSSEVLLGAPADGSFTYWKKEQDSWSRHLLANNQRGATNPCVADLDGDGALDVAGSNGHGIGIRWFQGPDWEVREVDSEIASPHALDAADLDGDGDIDLATATLEKQIVVWYENDGKGRFTRHDIDIENRQPSYDLRIEDVDSDGLMDILIAGHRAQNVAWYRQVKR